MDMPPELKKAKFWPSWLALGFLISLGYLPHSLLIVLGKIFGTLAYHVFKSRRHVVEVNIAMCFPELDQPEQQRLVKATMQSSIIGYLETTYSWSQPDNKLAQQVDYEGLELIEKYQKDGRGVLLIGSHFTTLDLAGRLLRLKIDVDSSYQKQSNPVFDYWILKLRLKRFKNMVEKTEMRRLVKVLKSGRVMWFACDQDLGRKHSVFVPFFGHQAATLDSISKILRMTKAKPLYFSHYRIEKNGKPHYLMRITDPFTEQLGDDDIANGTLINQTIEKAIREHPEQYMWVHRRFKTRPNKDDPKPYTKFKRKR